MKIGIVCYPTFGGSGIVATELGKALAVKGHEVHFITYDMPVRLVGFTRKTYYHQVKVTEYPLFEYPPYELALTNKLVDVVKFENLDLLHVHYAIPHATAAYMAREILKTQGINIPFITTLHGTDITLVGTDSSFEPAISFAINASDDVTAVSKSLRNDTFRYFNIQRDIKVIPNFVCLEHYSQPPNNTLRMEYAPDNERIISHISNFRKVKKVDDVVRIFIKISESIPAKLLLVGDGPERHYIEEMCRTMNIWDKVIFTGKVQTTNELLAISDIFILPSETESFGLAALEAMASGVPVISTNTGGLSEINKDGFSGYLHNVGDVDGMAASAIKILSDDNILQQFKGQALEIAKEYDIHKILPLYEDVYREVVKIIKD